MNKPQPSGSGQPPAPRPSSTVRDELQATLAARRELGPEYDDELIQAFLAKIERAIDQRIDARLTVFERQRGLTRRHNTARLAILLALAIPLSAIAGGIAGTAGLAVAWFAILILALRN
ncbi:MAG: hypothetical protein HY331_00195 [Chloroflexi bacterium]|nr:hypothetical protein [Chloroflexota bacterium]